MRIRWLRISELADNHAAQFPDDYGLAAGPPRRRVVGQFDCGRIVNWKTDRPERTLRACPNLLVIDPVGAVRFMTAASTSLSRARSAVLNAPCAVQLSRTGTLLGFLDIDSLPVQPGCRMTRQI